MAKRYGLILMTALLCLSFAAFQFTKSYAKDNKPTPEEVVAKHLESIGSPELLEQIKSRAVYGISAVQRPIGAVPRVLPESGKRTDPTNFLFASEGANSGMLLKFYDKDYPEDHFAYDGKDVTVKFIQANTRSPLGNFINSYSGMLREGLWGGVWSTAWPLLRGIKEDKFKLKYDRVDIDGVKFHQLSYNPKSRRYLNAINVRLFFEFDTYRHVRTEYELMGTINPTAMVTEQFSNFKTVDGMTLPLRYAAAFDVWKGINPTQWIAEARQISHNGSIDPQIFSVK